MASKLGLVSGVKSQIQHLHGPATQLKDHIENLVWLAVGSLLVYWGDGEKNLLVLMFTDERIDRRWLAFGILGVVINYAVFFYLYFGCRCWHGSKISPEKVAPWAIPLGTTGMILSAISFVLAWWDTLKWWAIPIMPILCICFVILVEYTPCFRGDCHGNTEDAKIE